VEILFYGLTSGKWLMQKHELLLDAKQYSLGGLTGLLSSQLRPKMKEM
jgi:hypothetical protein